MNVYPVLQQLSFIIIGTGFAISRLIIIKLFAYRVHILYAAKCSLTSWKKELKTSLVPTVKYNLLTKKSIEFNSRIKTGSTTLLILSICCCFREHANDLYEIIASIVFALFGKFTGLVQRGRSERLKNFHYLNVLSLNK